MKVRQDAWTEEDDLLLAETVLRHVREASTQLNAFEEVGDKLNRTSAACGFRWNAVVRHTYEKALQLAKKQRKQRNRHHAAKAGVHNNRLCTVVPVAVPHIIVLLNEIRNQIRIQFISHILRNLQKPSEIVAVEICLASAVVNIVVHVVAQKLQQERHRVVFGR